MSSSSSAIPSIATKRKGSSRVSLPYIPDDLLLNCLARVSILYYPTLSLVSKRFRSLLASSELYQTRTILGCTESCIYVCLYVSHDSNPRWFMLRRRPTRSPNPNDVFVSIPTHDYIPTWLTNTTIGSNIYTIGGTYEPSSKIFVTDSRSHTWQEVPSMQVARQLPFVSVFDGKIYVAGGVGDYGSSNLIECFDPETQTWEHLEYPGKEIQGRYIFKRLAIEGKLYIFGEKNVVYKPEEKRWGAVGWERLKDWNPDSYCEIDNVFHCYGGSRMLEWYDSEEESFGVLNGMEELLTRLKNVYTCVRLVDCGGTMAVLWEEIVGAKCEIWCAEISVGRCTEHQICGNVDWCGCVLTIPKSCYFFQLIAATVCNM